uniref:Uncharacterized protein n=1 Tax=Saimiri boliviensis boliviensis TaxID=39432 RepID=A0A2K6TV92_SAIBB
MATRSFSCLLLLSEVDV